MVRQQLNASSVEPFLVSVVRALSVVNQRAYLFAVHHALEVAHHIHVEYIDRQIVLLAHRGGGEVHHA